jgi:nitroreductase
MNIETKIINRDFEKLYQSRKSTRAFASTIPDTNTINNLFDAARWAPSSSNNQPWRYIFATHNEIEKFNLIADCLAESNKLWAIKAPLLIISLAKNITNTGKPYRHFLYDTGAANMALALQATDLGMQAHIMGGFDIEKVRTNFNIEENLEPVVIIAVGYQGNIAELPDNLFQRENIKERFSLDAIILK